MKNGDARFPYPNPPSAGFQEDYHTATIAVFWDDADLSREVGDVLYQVFTALIISFLNTVTGSINVFI